MFLLPDIPLDLKSQRIFLPHAAAVSVTGPLAPQLIKSINDDWIVTRSSRNREATGHAACWSEGD